MMRRWKAVIITGAAVLIVLAGIVVRAALGRPASDVINSFDIGSPGIAVLEPGTDPGQAEWGNGMKRIKLKNTGDVPLLVRVMILPVFRQPDGSSFTAGSAGIFAAPQGKQLVSGDFILYFHEQFDQGKSEHWIYNEQDGYFYYREVLYPQEETRVLLEGIDLAAEEEVLQHRQVDVEILADGIQAEGEAPGEWGITFR